MTEAEALVREAYAQWERGDFSSREWASDDFELILADGPSPGRFRGADVGRAWGEMIGMWEDFRALPEEVRDLGDGRVLVFTNNTGRSKGSGLELGDMHTRGANVIHVRDGKLTKLVAYFNRDQALVDVGLAHGSASPPPP